MSDSTKPNSFVIYRRLLGYMLRHWTIFMASVVGFMLFAASQPAVAQLMEYLIKAVESGDTTDRVLVPVALAVIAFARGIGYFIGNYCTSRVLLPIVYALRTELFDRLTFMPGEYFDKNGSGHLISMLTYNVLQVTDAATKAVKTVISEGLRWSR